LRRLWKIRRRSHALEGQKAPIAQERHEHRGGRKEDSGSRRTWRIRRVSDPLEDQLGVKGSEASRASGGTERTQGGKGLEGSGVKRQRRHVGDGGEGGWGQGGNQGGGGLGESEDGQGIGLSAPPPFSPAFSSTVLLLPSPCPPPLENSGGEAHYFHLSQTHTVTQRCDGLSGRPKSGGGGGKALRSQHPSCDLASLSPMTTLRYLIDPR
jgi:hypothetical protein